LDPNSAFARGYLGTAYAFGGECEPAIQNVQDAMRLSPRDFYELIKLGLYYTTYRLARGAERLLQLCAGRSSRIDGATGVPQLMERQEVPGSGRGSGLPMVGPKPDREIVELTHLEFPVHLQRLDQLCRNEVGGWLLHWPDTTSRRLVAPTKLILRARLEALIS